MFQNRGDVNLNVCDTRTYVALRNLINNDQFDAAIALFELAAQSEPDLARQIPKMNLISVIASSADLKKCLDFLSQLKKRDPGNIKWDMPGLEIMFENFIFKDEQGDPKEAYQFLRDFNNDDLLRKWFRSLNKDKFAELLTGLVKLPKDECYAALKPYLADIVASENLSIMLVIKRESPELYQELLNNLNKKNSKTANNILFILNNLDKLQEITDPAFRISALEHMDNIIAGFGMLDTNDVCLIAASMMPSDEPPPTVLALGEIYEYVNLLASAPKPLCERFIHAGQQHFLSGQINISENGEAELLLIEPLGYDRGLSAEMNLFISSKREIIHTFQRQFPDALIYTSLEKRQTRVSCTVFALDDVHNLYKLPGYYHSTDNNYLFKLLRTRIEETVIYEEISVHITSLPAQFLRTMGSRSLLDILQKPENKDAPLSRSKPVTGETYSQSKAGFFDREVELKTTLQNVRLHRKLIKMTKIVLEFLLSHSLAEVNKRMYSCTIQALSERLQAGAAIPRKQQ